MVAFFQRLLTLSLFTIVVSAASAPSLWAATTIDAHLDRSPVALNESFTLTFSASGTPDGSPDFTPLHRDFEILNQNQSSQISIVNGDYQKKAEWILTLMAKRAGRQTIPPIKFGTDSSRGLTIGIYTAPTGAKTNTTDSQQIKLQVELEKKQAMVREQLLLTVRLLRSVNLNAASLTEPEALDLECLIQKLGDDRDYEKRINNVRYLVTERRYALFPQQSGTLRIAPLIFEGRVPDRRPNRFDPFGQSGRVVRQRSDEQLIVVSPAQTTSSSEWLPALAVELSEDWSSDPLKLAVGEPVTRTITLRASGQSAAQLPPLQIPAETEVKIYPDQPTLEDRVGADGIIGIRTEKYALVPTQDGLLRIPPVELKWWDTVANKLRTARLPGRDLQAIAPPVTTAAETAPPTSKTAPTPTANGGETVTGIEDRFLPWPWWSLLCAILAAVWVTMMLIASKRQPRKAAPITEKNERTQRKAALLKKLLATCKDNDESATQATLILWGKVHFNLAEHANLGRIADLCPASLSVQIRRLQSHIYGHSDETWDGQELEVELKNFDSGLSKTSTEKKTKDLPELYPS